MGSVQIFSLRFSTKSQLGIWCPIWWGLAWKGDGAMPAFGTRTCAPFADSCGNAAVGGSRMLPMADSGGWRSTKASAGGGGSASASSATAFTWSDKEKCKEEFSREMTRMAALPPTCTIHPEKPNTVTVKVGDQVCDVCMGSEGVPLVDKPGESRLDHYRKLACGIERNSLGFLKLPAGDVIGDHVGIAVPDRG